jgi:hypothetical protein
VELGSAALAKAIGDTSPERPTVVKIASPGTYSDAQIEALGLPKSATKAKATRAKAPNEDKNP